ncbi:MAG: hypothetical protein JHC93_03670 [Parachlamydiales bacterium]|nr:hypothetical protein [Parachlamydiales bacterium]
MSNPTVHITDNNSITIPVGQSSPLAYRDLQGRRVVETNCMKLKKGLQFGYDAALMLELSLTLVKIITTRSVRSQVLFSAIEMTLVSVLADRVTAGKSIIMCKKDDCPNVIDKRVDDLFNLLFVSITIAGIAMETLVGEESNLIGLTSLAISLMSSIALFERNFLRE